MSDPQKPGPTPVLTNAALPAQSPVWFSLKAASEFLGVHYTTLRTWCDQGQIAAFRTPGGHRRFSIVELRRFIEERANRREQEAPASTALIDVALVQIRHEIQKLAAEDSGWNYRLTQDAEDVRRQRGRQLFALAISYLVKPGQRARLLEEAKHLGQEYGIEAAQGGVPLAHIGRAVQFFRRQLAQAMNNRNPESRGHEAVSTAEDMQLQSVFEQFFDEVLFSVLQGYQTVVESAWRPSAG
jgi:excisionase family DNA binding protein